MPIEFDLRAIRDEAKLLLRTASVPPLRITLLFLGVNLVLNLINSAATWFLGDTLVLTAANLPFSFVGVLTTLLSLVLLAGYTIYCLGVHQGCAMPYSTLLDAFPFAGKVILLALLQAILISLGLVLFILPGIYIAFSYAFALYHICEEPDCGVLEAMRRSRLEMRGRKMQLFSLIASFLPLLLLAGLAIGGCETYLNRVLPNTLGGSLLFSLAAGVLSGCAELYLLPVMRFAQIGFFRRVTQPPADEGPAAYGED